ncbi:MAG: ComEC/Rec2 family competence protein, partial [Chitinophagaceae bacterium]|nr:ComEC/Rec2 family competence protein [Chitinophagaceae bacterium]
YRLDMDRELVQQYAATGVAHIIAISGLHLGLLMQALMFLFGLFRYMKDNPRVLSFIVIIILWVFTLVTGAGPSVLRAALMFTVLLLGKVIGREGNSWNSLAASAFMILLISPRMLFDVGFQLSYSAMVSLFMFSRRIESLLKTDNIILKYFWAVFFC